MRKIRIGVTVDISKPTESFFTNGIKQNAISFMEAFSACRNVEKFYFVNLGTQRDLSQSPWKAYEENIIDLKQALDLVDVLVTVTVSLSENMLDVVSKKGIRVVKSVLGTEYHILTESVIFGRPAHNHFSRRNHHSAVWLSPHIFDTNKDLFEVLCNTKAHVSPYVWSPKFLESHVEIYKKENGGDGLYKPREKEKCVSVFEPNLNVVKTCITPILACEKMYRKAPGLLKKASMFGATEIMGSKPLKELVGSTEIFKARKIFFESRYPIAWSLLKHTDIALSHQRDLALNYLYFDAAWLGFPIVHNAHFVKELGYYYDGFDAEQAAELLVEVAKNFDGQHEEYLRKSREYISRFLPTHESNVRGYEELIELAAS